MQRSWEWALVSFLTLDLNSIASSINFIDEPPGSPGIPHEWAPAAKDAIGTSYETGARSPVWFTVSEGILTEVFYPSADHPQIGDLQILVTDGHSFFAEQKRDVRSIVRYAGAVSGSVVIEGQERRGLFRLRQIILTDPDSPVVRISTEIFSEQTDLKVYVLFKPALGNGSLEDHALATSSELSDSIPGTAVTLVADSPFLSESAGYVGFSDGWQDLSRNFRLTSFFDHAGPGNVALTGELPSKRFELALGFGVTPLEASERARLSLSKSIEELRRQSDSGWEEYVRSLRDPPMDAQSLRSALVIKMHEDKARRGAIVASLSKPGIPTNERAGGGNYGGYHLIWPRDLYHSAMGLLAAGDTSTPLSVLQTLIALQRENGSWAQNSWIDGSNYWSSIQLDEIAFPILLASQLEERGIHAMGQAEIQMIQKAASFLLQSGPRTEQDRWEENDGFVPNTLAIAIRGLLLAGRKLADSTFLNTASEWASQLQEWCVVPSGPHGENYFLRISPTGRPGSNESIQLRNGAGDAQANEILDGGFLDLVRMGIRDAGDPVIGHTLAILESERSGTSFTTSDGGIAFHRYNRDQYGPHSRGGYWPILAGERGHFAIAQGDFVTAQRQAQLLESASNEAGLLPEQVISPPNFVGLGTPRPLAWSHAEQIRLRKSLQIQRVYDGWMAEHL